MLLAVLIVIFCWCLDIGNIVILKSGLLLVNWAFYSLLSLTLSDS